MATKLGLHDMKLHEFFSRREFACKCGCGQDTIDAQLLEVLVDLRYRFHSPVIVNSGNRCIKHNMDVGGTQYSYHLRSKAADINVTGFAPKAVYKYLDEEYFNTFGIILYNTFVHIDVRESKYRK